MEVKNEFSINNRESVCKNHCNDPKAVIDYLNGMDGIYENNDEYNPSQERKMLTVSDDFIADMLRNKKL